jgi:hypothetical protein
LAHIIYVLWPLPNIIHFWKQVQACGYYDIASAMGELFRYRRGRDRR